MQPIENMCYRYIIEKKEFVHKPKNLPIKIAWMKKQLQKGDRYGI
jgi:hypothetical protein